MIEAFKTYHALSAEDRRAADICARPFNNNRTFKELFEAGFECSVAFLVDAVELGREMLADGFTEADAEEVAAAGR